MSDKVMDELDLYYSVRSSLEREKIDETIKTLDEIIRGRFTEEDIKQYWAEQAEKKKPKTIATIRTDVAGGG